MSFTVPSPSISTLRGRRSRWIISRRWKACSAGGDLPHQRAYLRPGRARRCRGSHWCERAAFDIFADDVEHGGARPVAARRARTCGMVDPAGDPFLEQQRLERAGSCPCSVEGTLSATFAPSAGRARDRRGCGCRRGARAGSHSRRTRGPARAAAAGGRIASAPIRSSSTPSGSRSIRSSWTVRLSGLPASSAAWVMARAAWSRSPARCSRPVRISPSVRCSWIPSVLSRNRSPGSTATWR